METNDSEDLQDRIRALEDENTRLRTASASVTNLKVSPKGAVSLYGLRRFPVTFYRSEWDQILSMSGEIMTFIEQNADQLKAKGTSSA